MHPIVKSATVYARGYENNAYFDALWDGERAREATEAAFAHDIAVLVTVRRELGLARDREDVVVDVDAHVLLCDAGQLERRGDDVLVFILMDIDPTRIVQYHKHV